MLIAITPEIYMKLEEIGFEKDEIRAIGFIHELKIGRYSEDISELVKRGISLNIRKEISDRIKELSWEMGEKNFGNREELYDRQNIL
jgi:hypothetical protein